jgi:hypothetical protein
VKALNRRIVLGILLLVFGATGILGMTYLSTIGVEQPTEYIRPSVVQGQVLSCPLRPQLKPMPLGRAVELARQHVASLGNPDLDVKEVMEFELNFYFIVYEKSTGVGAFEMLMDRYSGGIRPEPGPNMMWNTKYGMMSGMGRGGMMRGWRSASVSDMSVTVERAGEIAARYLSANLPGATVEEPDIFYGYYTFHLLMDGKIYGMLSVNGYTGQVWYHNWHGAFIAVKELH